MSLVEKALKKLQNSSVGAPATSTKEVSTADAPVSRVVPPVANAHVPVLPSIVRKRIEVRRTTLRLAGLLPPEHQEREIADQYRQIKRPLISAVTGRGGDRRENAQLIMVASALPGEGKTFTSVNLALSMAMEKDINILLVDADMPKPHISHIFGIDKERIC